MKNLEYKLLKAEARKEILQERPKENGRIVKKLERVIRNLQRELAAAGPEVV